MSSSLSSCSMISKLTNDASAYDLSFKQVIISLNDGRSEGFLDKNFSINSIFDGHLRLNLNQIDIPKSETNFIFEVFQILGYDSIDYVQSENNFSEITANNVFSHVQYHEQYAKFFSENLAKEIEFISSHFYELSKKEHSILSVETLEAIFSSESLQLNSEDQLLKVINKLYSKSHSYYLLIECIKFNFLSTKAIQEFIEIFDTIDLTKVTWNQICNRLKCEVKNEIQCDKRYTDKKVTINDDKSFIIRNNNKELFSKRDFSVITVIVGDPGVGKTVILTRSYEQLLIT